MLTRDEHRRAMSELSIAHITDPAHNRMRTRNAREKAARAMAELNREQDNNVPDDSDFDSAKRSHFQ